MFVSSTKTLLTEAIKRTFDADYPIEQFRNLHASIEFPALRQNYPGIWVDFDPTDVRIAGIGHVEETEGEDGSWSRFKRWRFGGNATFTLVAMTSLERDLLLDEVVKVIAFGEETAQRSEFRAYVEDNEFVRLNLQFDQLSLVGFQHSFGTPWETDESIYEVTVVLAAVGEFVSDGLHGTLASLSEIEVIPYDDQQEDPLPDPDGWS